MKHYEMTNPEGSSIINLTAPSGASGSPVVPQNANIAELFYRTDTLHLEVHNGTSWDEVATSADLTLSLALYGPLAANNTWTGIDTFTDTPFIKVSGGSLLVAQSSAALDNASFQGITTRNDVGTPIAVIGSIPNDLDSYVGAWTRQTAGSPDVWNKVFGAHLDALTLQLTTTDVTYDGIPLFSSAGGTITGDVQLNANLTLADSGSPQPRILNAGGVSLFGTGSPPEIAPSYSFVSDTDTGMYLDGTNILAFSTAGTQRMIVDALGVVTFNRQAQVVAEGGSFIVAQAIDVAHDSAFQGHLTRDSAGTSIGFFGSIPADVNSAITAYAWQTSGSPIVWNRVFGAHMDAKVLQLTETAITYDGITLMRELLEDTSPQLGGTLDPNGFTITGYGPLAANNSWGGTNTFTDIPRIVAPNNSWLECESINGTQDNAIHGMSVLGSDGISRCYIGAVPINPATYFTVATWQEGSPGGWNVIMAGHRDAKQLALTETDIKYDGVSLLTNTNSLVDLTDTSITGSPIPDKNLIYFDTGSSKWINGTAADAGIVSTKITDGGVGTAETYVDTDEFAQIIVSKLGTTGNYGQTTFLQASQTNVQFRAGSANAGGAAGGTLNFDAGAGNAAGNGGNLDLTSGVSTSGTGGLVNVTGGASTSGIGGGITVKGGSGASSGNVTLTTSPPTSGSVGTVNVTGGAGGAITTGGDVNINGGTSSSAKGGEVDIRGGTSSAGGISSGDVHIQGGNNTSGIGGEVLIRPGRGSSRPNDGTISLVGPTAGAPSGFRIHDGFNVTDAYIGFTVAAAMASSVIYTLPEDGSNGQVMQTDGSGILSWGDFLPLTGGTLTGDLTLTSTGSPLDYAQILVPDGSAAAPSYSFANDTDTGMFLTTLSGSPTLTALAFAYGGTEFFRIESDGTLSVPAGSPGYEALVTDDDDIPNKKYVDDTIASNTGQVTVSHTTYTATGGSPAQDTFTGADDNGDGLSYVAGFLDVYLNGVLLVDTTDYTATSGTSVVLTVAAAEGDILQTTAHAAALGASVPEFIYTATASQTTFTGADNNSVVMTYAAGQTYVYKNGVMLANGTDYTATDGTSIVLTVAAALNDTLQIVAPLVVTVANTYTQTETDANFAPITRGRKNLIINGNFAITQRGTAFTGLTADTWTLDRWLWQETSDATVDVRQVATTTVEGQSMYLKMNVTTADTSISAAQHAMVRYKMEGYDAGAFTWNATDQAVKRDITLSFTTVHTRTGTYCVSIQNSAIDRSYIAEYTQSVANTVEEHTITFPAPTDGTWLVGNNVGLFINFIVACGTNFHGVADTWLSANDIATSNQVNALGAVTDNFRIYAVQLEVGTVATDFEHIAFSEQLALCQRYYEKSFSYSVAPAEGVANTSLSSGMAVAINATDVYSGSIVFAVEKSAVADITYYRGNATTTAARWAYYDGSWQEDTTDTVTNYPNSRGFQARLLVSGKTANESFLLQGHWTAEAEL